MNTVTTLTNRSLLSIGIFLLFGVAACSSTQTKGSKNADSNTTEAKLKTDSTISTSVGDEVKYQFIIANFSNKSSFTFEVLMDGRMLNSVEVAQLDKQSTSPGFTEFPLRLPQRIKSLKVRVKGDGAEEETMIDFNNGKYISVVFDNDYYTKQKGKRLIVEQRMTGVVYD